MNVRHARPTRLAVAGIALLAATPLLAGCPRSGDTPAGTMTSDTMTSEEPMQSGDSMTTEDSMESGDAMMTGTPDAMGTAG